MENKIRKSSNSSEKSVSRQSLQSLQSTQAWQSSQQTKNLPGNMETGVSQVQDGGQGTPQSLQSSQSLYPRQSLQPQQSSQSLQPWQLSQQTKNLLGNMETSKNLENENEELVSPDSLVQQQTMRIKQLEKCNQEDENRLKEKHRIIKDLLKDHDIGNEEQGKKIKELEKCNQELNKSSEEKDKRIRELEKDNHEHEKRSEDHKLKINELDKVNQAYEKKCKEQGTKIEMLDMMNMELYKKIPDLEKENKQLTTDPPNIPNHLLASSSFLKSSGIPKEIISLPPDSEVRQHRGRHLLQCRLPASPPAVTNIRMEILDVLRAELTSVGIQLEDNKSGPALVVVINCSRLPSDVERDVAKTGIEDGTHCPADHQADQEEDRLTQSADQ